MKTLFIVILCLLIVLFGEAFFVSKAFSSTNKKVSKLSFKKTDDSNNSESSQGSSFLEKIKRFLPWNRRVTLQKTYEEVETSSGMRYHIRLLDPKDLKFKRHIVTRILRYFPDITWETAESIVNQANNEGAALLRVLNSKVCLLIP